MTSIDEDPERLVSDCLGAPAPLGTVATSGAPSLCRHASTYGATLADSGLTVHSMPVWGGVRAM
jgi:hypothetical protein